MFSIYDPGDDHYRRKLVTRHTRLFTNYFFHGEMLIHLTVNLYIPACAQHLHSIVQMYYPAHKIVITRLT